MKTAGYIGRLLPGGYLSITSDVMRELGLHPNEQVQVVLISIPQTAEEQAAKEAERARKRHEAWQAIMELRQSFAGMDFSLTDEIVKMREEEDV
jgi:hypothetical protein